MRQNWGRMSKGGGLGAPWLDPQAGTPGNWWLVVVFGMKLSFRLASSSPSSSPNQPFWVFFGVFGRTMRLSSAGSIVPSGNSNVVQTYCLESGIGIVTRSTQNVSAAAQSPQGRQGSHLLVSG